MKSFREFINEDGVGAGAVGGPWPSIGSPPLEFREPKTGSVNRGRDPVPRTASSTVIER